MSDAAMSDPDAGGAGAEYVDVPDTSDPPAPAHESSSEDGGHDVIGSPINPSDEPDEASALRP